MPITVTCTCGKRLAASDEAAGQRVKCPHCGQVMNIPVGVTPAREPDATAHKPLSGPAPSPTRPFMAEVTLAFVYPLRPVGLVTSVIGAWIFALLSLGFGIITLPLMILALGYLAAHFLSIVQVSAGGDPKLPNLPDLTDIVDDILKPIVWMLAAIFMSLMPQIIYGIYAWKTGAKPSTTVLTVLSVWSSIYFPMAVMSVAIWRSVAAVSPHVVLPAILRIPGQHVMMAAMVWVVWRGCGYLQNEVIAPAVGRSAGIILSLFVFYLVLLYFISVIGRIIGITHWVYRKKIAWFRMM